NALRDEPIPVYGDGKNVRDWIYVDDHCRGILQVLLKGKSGGTYNIGSRNARRNIDVVTAILQALGKPASLIRYVKDRPGHDRRYAIDCTKSERELGWRPAVAFEEGLRQTVAWYREHADWVAGVRTGAYLKYYEQQYGSRS